MKYTLQLLTVWSLKLFIYGVFLYFLTIGNLFANNGGSQNKSVKDTYVDLDLKDASVVQIFKSIESQTEFTFQYDRHQIDHKYRYNFNGVWLVNDVLMEMSQHSGLHFRQINSMISVKPRPEQKEPVQEEIEVVFQSFRITGVVVDEESEGLPGVNVLIKGTASGTVTDVEGRYSIDVPGEDAVLIYSYIGFKAQEHVVGARRIIDVTLAADVTSLEDVVVVGYGEQKKISVVGAQSTINVEELQQPVSNVSTMLAGRVSGLTGVQRSGQPGYDGSDIWIRGISTFTSAGNSPLILVDGVERSMSNIDPMDIASFTILKDAAATAVYGVRGANGVILIQTKKGKIGPPKVSIDYNEGITTFTRLPDLAGGVTYMKLANEALTTRGEAAAYSEDQIQKTQSGYDPMLYPDVDWFDTVFKKWGRNRKSTVNLSGGAESAQYYVSVGYYDETGLFVNDALQQYNSSTRFKRYNVTSNTTLEITKSTKIDLGIQGYISEGTYPSQSLDDIFTQAMMVPPVEYPVMYPGGYVPGRSSNGDLRNPYADVALRGYQAETKNQLYTNLKINQKLDSWIKGLSWTGMFAFDAYNEHFITRSKRESTYFVDTSEPRNADGTLNLVETYEGTGNYLSYSRSNGGNRRFYLQTSFNYDHSFGKHAVSGLLLFNRQDYEDAFADSFTESIPYRSQGLAARATYSYAERYFLEVNAGYNGSENFAPSNRYGFFPSVAVGWVISNEPFFQPMSSVVNFLKIRYSDGKVGSSSGAGRFLYLSFMNDGATGFSYGESATSVGGITESTYAVDVTWVESHKQDLGLEFNAFDSNLNVIFDLFKERTNGAFLQRGTVPNYIGLNTDPYGNLGIVENKGFDGSVTYKQRVQEAILQFRGTFSYNQNKVIENDSPEPAYPWLDHRGHGVLAEYGYVAERLYTTADDKNGDGYVGPEDGAEYASQFGNVMPGDIKYKDLNGDGTIDSYDQKKIGVGDVPALTYGFGLSAFWKGFDASVFFQGQYRADVILSGNGIMPFNGDGGRGNLYREAVNRWTEENDNPYAMYPRLSYGSSGVGQTNNTQTSTWWLRQDNFLRLKTAEIGYTIPKNVTDRFKLTNVRFYMRGINLFTFSRFKLWDPELDTSNGGAYPNNSVYSAGFNVQF